MDYYSLEGKDTPWLLSRLQAGDYSRIKSDLVSRENLTRISRQLGINELFRTGEGSFEAEKDSPNLPGETLEALIGACALDSSYGDHFDFKRIDLAKMFRIVSKILDLDNYLKSLEITLPNKKIKLTEEDDKNPLCALNKLVMKGFISKPVCSFNEPTRDERGRDIWKCSCAVMGYPLLDSSTYYSNKADAKKEAVKKLIDMIKGAHPEFFC